MTLFHQSSNQLKVFPVRLNEIQLVNTSLSDPIDYFSDYDDTLDGISLVAFLPIIVIGILLAILIMFFKVKSLRSNRGQLDRLDEIYQVLETVDQIAADPYAVNTKLIDEIRYALVLDDGDSTYFASNRRDSFYSIDEFLDHPNNNHTNYYHQQPSGNQQQNEQLIKLNNEQNSNGSQLV